MKFQKIALATMLLAISSTSLAGPNGQGKRMFDRMDADGDSYISFNEFKQPGKNRGPRADLDGNGEVTQAEVAQHVAEKNAEMAEKANRRFEKMDLNEDGVVTKDEARETAFYRLDQNQDGFLSPEELKRPGFGGKGRDGKGRGDKRHDDRLGEQ
ncbi:MAG: Ca2+-binding EF-hand superfamily protein [Candidatus Azotimanducaceae bacterium]|jgi:Ca2+-binding EF-hand superfamily protein